MSVVVAQQLFPFVFPVAASGDYVKAYPFGTEVGNQVWGSFWGSDTNVLVPFFLPPGLFIDRIAMNIVSAGSSGSVIRLNAYDMSVTTRRPSSLLAENTIDSTSTGTKEATFTKFAPSNPYRIVFIGAASQGAPATTPTIASVGGPGLVGSTSNNGGNGGYYQSSVSGACPASFTVSGVYNTLPRMLLRLSA